MSVVHLFAGAGGWEQDFHIPDSIGIDNNKPACNTAELAGHKRICEDITKLDPHDFLEYEGITASPPCQTFSVSGNGAGFYDKRGLLTMEPLRWAKIIKPKFIALEQVVDVTWYWRQVARELAAMGYYTYVAQLNCAHFGVPQDRFRSVLLASRVRKDIQPSPSTYRTTLRDIFPERERHVMVSVSNSGKKDANGNRIRGVREMGQPGFTITGKCLYNKWRHMDTGREWYISEPDNSKFQGFPADYPWQGLKAERQQQIGNAVPPPFAAHLLSKVA